MEKPQPPKKPFRPDLGRIDWREKLKELDEKEKSNG